MSELAFVMILPMFGLPIAAVIILVVCLYHNIQSHKEMKHFEAAMHQCESVRGWEFTKRLLTRCSDSHLPVCTRIELLEHFAGVKDMHVAISERMAKN